MKCIIVDTTINSPLIGGAHTFLPKIMGGLAKNGHETHFLTHGEPNEKVRDAIMHSGAVFHSDLWKTGELVDDVAPRLAAWINALSPDVYVISASGDMGWVVLPLLDPNIATLTIGHNDSETFYMPARYYARFLTRAVGVSEEICETYVDSCHMERDRVVWIPYGVTALESVPESTSMSHEITGGTANPLKTKEVQTFEKIPGQRDSGTGPLRLIYVGRLDEPQKRVSDLVSVARRLTAEGFDYTLDIVGDGEEMPAVRQGLAAEIASGCVQLHGWLDGNEVIQRLRAADVFLLTSNFEGFCIALIESMANGAVPIVTNIRSGNKELVSDGDNGFIVPIGDIDEFVKHITNLGKDRQKLVEFRNKAWEAGKAYSIERMVANYERVFSDAAADARDDPRTPVTDFPLMPSCRSRYPLWLRRLKTKVLAR